MNIQSSFYRSVNDIERAPRSNLAGFTLPKESHALLFMKVIQPLLFKDSRVLQSVTALREACCMSCTPSFKLFSVIRKSSLHLSNLSQVLFANNCKNLDNRDGAISLHDCSCFCAIMLNEHSIQYYVAMKSVLLGSYRMCPLGKRKLPKLPN